MQENESPNARKKGEVKGYIQTMQTYHPDGDLPDS